MPDPIIPPDEIRLITVEGKMLQEFRRWCQAITERVNALEVLSGAGTPEGSVVASPSRLYADTAGGQLYFKATGDGDTGWITV